MNENKIIVSFSVIYTMEDCSVGVSHIKFGKVTFVQIEILFSKKEENIPQKLYFKMNQVISSVKCFA